jgi:predicted MPP superfamily phosphohydrolase
MWEIIHIKRGRSGLLFVFIFLLVSYTIWDNNRIIITEQEIPIENLPKEFEGYTILQITDFHERVFGKGQKRLLAAVNSIDYDAIVFTGDMLAGNNSKNYDPFYTLIEGINNKKSAFYVPGNTDPLNYTDTSELPYKKSEFVKGTEERGVSLLEFAHSVELGGENIYFINFENSFKESTGVNKVNKWQHKRQLEILNNVDEEDVLIALNHFPHSDHKMDMLISENQSLLKKIDLIIAGHYHGGQIRIPFLGAIFIPDYDYPWGGFFPPRDRVKGLWEYKHIQQYVSTGLGSSDAIPFLKFRFLNPPEINVITLKNKQ